MKPVQRLWVHGALLGVAVLGALYMWTRDPNAPTDTADVRVWDGKPADVQKIVIDSKTKLSVLESKSDETGRWFEGSVKNKPAPSAKEPPARADSHEEPSAKDSGKEPAEDQRPIPLLSVKPAQRIVDAVAPLKAVREVGIVEGDPAGDFGLAIPDATISFTIGGVVRSLAVGTEAPGGTDRYVRVVETNMIYAVHGDFLRDLMAGEHALTERDAHGFEDEDVKSVRILAGDKSRDVKRFGVAGWADSATPDASDDTIGTWMNKIARLRPTEFLTSPPTGTELVLRLEYVGEKGPIGFLELQRGTIDDKPVYYLRTEHTRKHAKAMQSVAEQIIEELEGLLK